MEEGNNKNEIHQYECCRTFYVLLLFGEILLLLQG